MKKKLNLNKISVASFATSLNKEKRQTLHGGDKLPVSICGVTNPVLCNWASELQTACCPASFFNCVTDTTCTRITNFNC